jgi:hypothetical protein
MRSDEDEIALDQRTARRAADVFATKADAYAAIDRMPFDPGHPGVQYSVEP